MYPKVKVKEQIEEAGQYAYEKSSLLSLKAFEWISAHHFSPSDEPPHLVARIPGSFVPKSPPPTFRTPKEETSKKDNMGVEENRKNARANSAPRPRAVLSSPDNDGIFGGKRQTRKELFSGLKNNTSGQNKHTQSKVFPKSAVAVNFSPSQSNKKEATESQNKSKSENSQSGFKHENKTFEKGGASTDAELNFLGDKVVISLLSVAKMSESVLDSYALVTKICHKQSKCHAS